MLLEGKTALVSAATGENGPPLHDGLRVLDLTSAFPGRSFAAVNVLRCPASGREWRCKR
jgi:hypothetical protein